jgi:hypothetical protein
MFRTARLVNLYSLQLSAARRGLEWSAASERLLFDGDDAILRNSVDKTARRGHRSLPTAATHVLCAQALTVPTHVRVWLASPAGHGFQWVKLIRVWGVTSRTWPIACVVKYIRAWLPSQAPRGGLASQTHTCKGTVMGAQNGKGLFAFLCQKRTWQYS